MHKNWFKVLKDQGLIDLPITVEHARATGALPMHHGDPFDRLLIAQALVEDFTIVTHDRTFEQYEAKALVF
jgi:PIN domain nuclease of toxin-antitoxin system